MTTQQDSVDVERLRAIVSTILFRSSLIGTATQVEQTTAEIVAALSLPITQRDEQGDQARREAIMLLDEVNKQAKSRAFYGIHQTLHAKLCTIRMTLARPDWQAPATAIRRLSIEQGDQDGGEG